MKASLIFINSKVTIKARVTGKTPIKTWSNARGEGKLFSIDLLDDSGEIKMTGFNTAVDQYYDTIKVRKPEFLLFIWLYIPHLTNCGANQFLIHIVYLCFDVPID